MTPEKILLYNALLPGLVSLAIAFLAWRRHTPSAVWSSTSTGLAVALAYCLTHGPLSGGWPAFPASEASGWLPYQVIAAAACGVLLSALRRSLAIAAAVRLLLSLLTSFIVLRPLLEQWSTAEAVAQIGVPAALLFIGWSGTDALAERVRGPALPHALLVVAIVSSITFMNSGYASLAQLTGAFAAAIGGTCVVALLRRDFSLAGAGVALVSVFLISACVNALAFASLTRTNALLLIGALLAPNILWLPPLARRGRWQQTAVAVVAALVPAGIALALALLGKPAYGY